MGMSAADGRGMELGTRQQEQGTPESGRGTGAGVGAGAGVGVGLVGGVEAQTSTGAARVKPAGNGRGGEEAAVGAGHGALFVGAGHEGKQRHSQ